MKEIKVELDLVNLGQIIEMLKLEIDLYGAIALDCASAAVAVLSNINKLTTAMVESAEIVKDRRKKEASMLTKALENALEGAILDESGEEPIQ